MADSVLAPWIFSALFNHRAVAADAAGRTVFVFPGHGSRWTDMAIELLEWAPAFASEMRACEIAFSKFFDWSLLDVVQGNAGRLTVRPDRPVVARVIRRYGVGRRPVEGAGHPSRRGPRPLTR